MTSTRLVVASIALGLLSTTSDQLIAGSLFTCAEDDRKHLVIVMAEDEYETDKTLPAFAERHLRSDFRVTTVFGEDADGGRSAVLPGIEALEDADLAVLSIRRKAIPAEQLQIIRTYVESGKPLVALRTTSHAFSLRDQKPPDGYTVWPKFDQEVLGGRYEGHYGRDPATFVWVKVGAEGHPILEGVRRDKFRVASWLYKNRDLADSTQVLLVGQVGEDGEVEPVAWTNRTPWGGKVFYTSLGHPGDFKLPAFEQHLTRALHWAADAPATQAVR